MENKENQLPKKRQRTENWLEDDKYLLKELVKERVHAIENKNTDTNTNRKKLEAWKDLHLNFNSMCKGVERTIAQLKSQWGIIKMGAKKTKAAERQAIMKTGGGPPPPTVDEDADDIGTWLPNEFIVDLNEFDSDKNQISQIPVDVKPAATMSQALASTSTSQAVTINEIYIGTPSNDQDLTSEDIVISNIDTKGTENNEKTIKDFKRPTSDLHNSSRKVKKLKLAPANIAIHTQQSILTIAEVETKCRQELHKIQMENEKKKGRNLDLEYEILEFKLMFYQTD